MSNAPLFDTRLERMSLDEWAALPEDAPGELVDGYRVEEEVPDNVHELIVAWLIGVLRAWDVPKRAIVLGSGAKFAVANDRGRMCDVSVFLPSPQKPPRRGLNRNPPSIAIEVVSPSLRDARRDRVEKLGEYASFGVRWYWLVDPGLRSLQVHELNADGRYVHVVDALGDFVERVPGCNGLTLDLAGLWGECDALGEEDVGER